MKTNDKQALVLALAVGTVALVMGGAGCSDSSSCGDGGTGCVDSGTQSDAGGDAETLFFLTRGAACYKVDSVTNVTDGCDRSIATTSGAKYPSNFDVTSLTFSLGNQVGSPVMASFGSGVVSHNMATLTRNNTSGTLPCTWTEMTTATMTLTAGDTFTLAVNNMLSGFATACTAADLPPGGAATCTSTWTWAMSLTTDVCTNN